MKIKIRPDDASALQENDWLQTDGWLAELRDDRCQQTDPGFWGTGPVVLWDRYMAVARAARAAMRSDGTVGATAWGSSRDPGGAADGYPLARPPEPGWHQ
jgi:hypothetical protein